MAAKKRKKNSATKRRSRTGLLLLRVLLWMAVLSALALAAWMGADTAWNAMTRHHMFAVSADEVFFNTPDFILKPGMERELRARLGDAVDGRHIFDRSINAAVDEKISGLPWIRDVKEIRRQLPNRIEISLDFRKPSGIVKLGDERLFVDSDGFWLPDDLYIFPPEPASGDLPVIVHDGLRRPPRGRQWEGRALPAGARLRRFLCEHAVRNLLDITQINVTNVGAEARGRNVADITLLAASGAIIAWGTTDAYDDIEGLDRREDEPSDRLKLLRLSEFLNEFPGLENVRHLDLRFHRITYVMNAE